MTLGVIMMVHAPFAREADIVRHWIRNGVPVVLHIDRKTPKAVASAFVASLADVSDGFRVAKSFSAEWGRWSLVEASLDAAGLMLRDFPEVQRVLLTSGSCLPLRPVDELRDYLDRREGVEIIESARTEEVPWTVGGLSAERFTLYFPFSWRRHRRLFDRFVALQRRWKVERKLPEGVDPHLGSQWWCLTRQMLERLRADPDLPRLKRFFRTVWIPDESFFQTMVRRYGCKVESNSLTLAKFDQFGKPAIFYDDHLELLRRSNCFIARKIWPKADRLYDVFLAPDQTPDLQRGLPNRGRIDRLFSLAQEQQSHGRVGLYMQSRFPRRAKDVGVSAARYSVFEGFDDVFINFEGWIQRRVVGRVHGHLFGPDRAEFAMRSDVFRGGLSSNAAIRDYNPGMFLTNLLWNARGENQHFLFGPRDQQKISAQIAKDVNASVYVITGAWFIPLLAQGLSDAELRRRAAALQTAEDAHLKLLRGADARARVVVWPLADVLRHPRSILETLFAGNEDIARKLAELPKLQNLAGLAEGAEHLRNLGLHLYLLGDVATLSSEDVVAVRPKPYLVE